MADLVDIILPTHRRPHTIGCAVESVLRQSHADFRLHVVGDGCDDETEAAARAFDDPRVCVYRFPKAAGYGYANRNRVLRRTDGEFVAYLCDDDLWFPDHLERGLAELGAGDLGLVAFRSCHVQYPDTLDPHFFAFDWRGPFATRFLRNWFMGSVTCVHRRRVFDRVGYWNDELFRFGDREFYNRVRVSDVPSAYRDVVTVLRFYAQHWDGRYASIAEPLQRRYVAALGDEAWREALRERARSRGHDLATRRRQWGDFARFGLRSGPKFARFWYQKLSSELRGRRGGADVTRSEERPADHHE
jgi:glycosyltransferase involved in cell wall biosynthesis